MLSPCRVSRMEPPESSPHPNPISVSDLPQTIPREVVYPFSLHYSPSVVNHNPLTLLSPPSPVTRAVVPTRSFSCLFTQPPVGGRNKRKPPSKKKKKHKREREKQPQKKPRLETLSRRNLPHPPPLQLTVLCRTKINNFQNLTFSI